MKADKPSHLVPRLRFPEFRDSAAWKTRNLGDVVSRGGNETFDPKTYNETPYLIELENIESDTGRILGISELKEHMSLKTRFQAGDVLYGKLRPYLRKFARPTFNGICTSEIWVLRSTVVSSAFLFHFVQTERFAQLANISSGSRMPRADWNFLASKDFGIPQPAEQNRIADCLGSLDDLIAVQGRRLEVLRGHKRGLMQRLFPRPGETVPRLRFPEFQRAGDWRRDQIGNVASIRKGKGIAKADITKNGSIPCIRYAELYTHYGEVIHKVVSQTNLPQCDLMLSLAEDVIVPASGETRIDIARASCVLIDGVALGSDLNVLRSDLHGPFFSYLLNGPLRFKIARMAQGDTVAHLYPKQLSKVWLVYPSRIEQQKIADCLGSLDKLIATQGQKLEALRRHKKGLMQQLFPNLETK